MSVESYATLLNLKMVVPSSKSNYVAVDRDYWIYSFGSRIAEIDLDESWYLKRHPDVEAAIEKGLVSSAQQHYCESGYFEHRMPYQINVDEKWYIGQYEDVQTAIAKQHFTSAQEHFESIGFKEGRHPYPSFALRQRARQSAASNAA